ncbi:hypothetical protein [Flagellimonas nanhaiensis]|uniref:Uncharacterized protein n=1 Tax=Flagellimonas nanhaiensis TaxID=2292706 RepID=A0A371JS70_9FLAO|nr:hypothetical protein [Allomuricauda nanhaiensis]RDY60662.1 hypothetical protein DX873_00330 [Allomuricauda nanhaiensis]
MKKLNTAQKTILILGILGLLTAIYGKFNGWEYKTYFILFYTSTSFMWIAFLDSKEKCCYPFKRKKTRTDVKGSGIPS